MFVILCYMSTLIIMPHKRRPRITILNIQRALRNQEEEKQQQPKVVKWAKILQVIQKRKTNGPVTSGRATILH